MFVSVLLVYGGDDSVIAADKGTAFVAVLLI